MTATIPFTALVHDGVMARCYLALLRDRGFVFERILRLVYRPPGFARLLPAPLRVWYARQAQQAAAMYWVARLPRDRPEIFSAVQHMLRTQFGLPDNFFENLVRGFDYAQCAAECASIEIENFRDARLAGAIAALPAGPILFTGGGILPATLLQDPARPFLHVHPGRLPQVRGADGVLWSQALFGRPSASCFVMAPGLDTGNLIEVCDFPSLAMVLPQDVSADVKTLYRFIYAYCDPVLRADLLCRIVVARTPEALLDIAATAVPQDLGAGQTFNFMHPQLQAAVLHKLFPCEA